MKVQNPIVGHAAGTLANMVYQTYHGATVVHEKPLIYHYPDTPSQQICQGKFYDVQRFWLPIYRAIAPKVSKTQGANKNKFDLLSHGIYQALNVYDNPFPVNPPQFFGLDPKNRVRPHYENVSYEFNDWQLNVNFDRCSYESEILQDFNRAHYFLLNRSAVSMYYREVGFNTSYTSVWFSNTNDWSKDDEIILYVALSSASWLSNFNLQ